MSVSQDEGLLQLEARLAAQETLLVTVTARFFQLLEALSQQHDFSAERNRLRQVYSSLTVRDVDPVVSDLMTGQFCEALDHLLGQVEEKLG